MAADATASHTVLAPFAGVVVALPHGNDEQVVADTPVVVLEAMKMEHEVLAGADGVVAALVVAIGDAVEEGQPLLTLAPGAASGRSARAAGGERPPGERADLE